MLYFLNKLEEVKEESESDESSSDSEKPSTASSLKVCNDQFIIGNRPISSLYPERVHVHYKHRHRSIRPHSANFKAICFSLVNEFNQSTYKV